MGGSAAGFAPENPNTEPCSSASMSASELRAERIGPRLVALSHWNTANSRVSPPSTSSSTTTSALSTPDCGRARSMLSIFTASATRWALWPASTGAPVSGHSTGAALGLGVVGVALGVVGAASTLWCEPPPQAVARVAAAARKARAMRGRGMPSKVGQLAASSRDRHAIPTAWIGRNCPFGQVCGRVGIPRERQLPGSTIFEANFAIPVALVRRTTKNPLCPSVYQMSWLASSYAGADIANDATWLGTLETPGISGLLKYATSRGFLGLRMSNTRRPHMMKLQATMLGLTRLGSEQ